MSLSELRGQLRELRKSASVRPISKMKKHEVILELESHKPKAKPVVEDVESDYEEPVEPVKKVAVKKVAVEKPVKAPAPKKVKEEVAEKPKKAPAPKKEKVVKEEAKPAKVSIKSAPRKKAE